ncbi:DUF455 family protein [Leptospira gomenensis]|uniref:DUF455 family protein n=1 Tax=Leptospira gomenensis TaxID=2484974 RepID=A0A5F1YD94_9LEPT|nr:DUF455 family protein [Leptospira gomenensis]TGK35906.1 DUF455 family protein [Leptospira gomenensis]TGK40062.1 DUF455 family protein [Leptospira gomenensis]TGK51512.1 DUF455 family protein [Leptospira gomenensis]TGK68069.1 DUF455 family protein [Leptospira gomenensis]
MTLNEFAERVLFGPSLEDKLFSPADPPIDITISEYSNLPVAPVRDKRIQISDRKSKIPRLEQLFIEDNRYVTLHHFANHELMAIELFAYAILKFQDAPSSVRFGLYRTLLEEQTHLRLYLSEMKKGGMELGDRPLNYIFWKQLPRMSTLEKFYAVMAISFEGANLDFSKIYTLAFERFGDSEKAAIMRKVYEDEIKHVRRGYDYIRKRMPEDVGEWDHYRSLIEFPFTPRRAKGYHYFPDTRIEAGFSREFVTALENYEDEYTGRVNSRILKEVLDLDSIAGKS